MLQPPGVALALLGPMDPPGGVAWENWDYALKQQLQQETGVSVAYRYRKQLSKKQVTCSGPTASQFPLECPLESTLERLANNDVAPQEPPAARDGEHTPEGPPLPRGQVGNSHGPPVEEMSIQEAQPAGQDPASLLT